MSIPVQHRVAGSARLRRRRVPSMESVFVPYGAFDPVRRSWALVELNFRRRQPASHFMMPSVMHNIDLVGQVKHTQQDWTEVPEQTTDWTIVPRNPEK